MDDSNGERTVARRALLRASAGTVALSGISSAHATGGTGDAAGVSQFDDDCPEGTLEPSMTDCEGATTEAVRTITRRRPPSDRP